jgi:hypothetical protein
MECGRLLIEAKAQVGHGGWLPWLEANCTLRPRTAQAYMRLARELPKLPEQEAQRVADLSVRDAIAQLSRQAHDLAALFEAAAAGVLEAAADERLRDVLVRACNREQQRASRSHDDHPGEWVTVELPPSLPPPDELLVALLAKEIEPRPAAAGGPGIAQRALLPDSESAPACDPRRPAYADRRGGARRPHLARPARGAVMTAPIQVLGWPPHLTTDDMSGARANTAGSDAPHRT